MLRLVLVIGLPFANEKDPELKARMEYLDEQCAASRLSTAAAATTIPSISGREYYIDKCMKAVNQSIGMCHHALACFVQRRSLLCLSESVQAALFGMLLTMPVSCLWMNAMSGRIINDVCRNG